MVRRWGNVRPSLLVFVFAILALGSALMLAPGRATLPPVNPTCPAPQSIPTGFDYPQSAATVEQWVKEGKVGRTRQHGWNVWAALNQPAASPTGMAQPIWQSWCTETQAFASSRTLAQTDVSTPGARPMRQFKLDNGLRTVADPINFKVAPFYAVPQPVLTRYKGSSCILPATSTSPVTLANGPTLQNNGDVMIAGVIYNKPAFDWIRSTGVYQAKVLAKLKSPTGGIGAMASFPAGSVSLKPMMWPVQASGFTALPVWDNPGSDDGVYAGFEIQGKWPRAVAITPTPQSGAPAPATISFLHGVTMAGNPLGPNTYANPRAVGIDQFYHYRPNLAAMNLCDRAILDASAYYAYGRMFQQGDYLALVAMHVMTKEQAAWTFQSVWWHDRPDDGPYAADRPTDLRAQGPWAHYLMAATYGIPAASPRGLPQWPVAFNPYIELAADHPIRTNCMNCHHRAAWPHQNDEYKKPGGPGALDIFSQDNKVIFDGKVQVDSLWSISDRVPPTAGRVGSAAAKR